MIYLLKEIILQLPACLAIIVTICGFFITHFLETERQRKSKKLELCVELMKSLRFLLNEPYIRPEKQQELRDKLVDSLYPFALVITEISFKNLENTIKGFVKFTEGKITKDEFNKLQNKMINGLRKEFGFNEEIDFEFFAIQLPQDTPRTETRK